jgi:hypothetical protein
MVENKEIPLLFSFALEYTIAKGVSVHKVATGTAKKKKIGATLTPLFSAPSLYQST